MDTILVFRHPDLHAARLRLAGINRFAHEAGWNVQCYEERFDATGLKAIKDFWHPAGAIITPNDNHNEYDVTSFSPSNTVLLDSFPPGGLERFSAVITDCAAVAETAARELMRSRCASYGFVPWLRPRIWSENRRRHFKRILGHAGITLHEFAASGEHLDARALQQELIPWLTALPKPCGILAANDRVGENVLHACQLAHIAVPFDCRVVAVDDTDTICENTLPTMSSVALDFAASGYAAAKMLHELLSGVRTKPTLVSTAPLGLTRRSSSRIFLQTDSHALQALELIHAKACEGLTAREVVDLFPCSRRLAEIRFRKATGHSILEEIQSCRLARAKKLLRNPYQRLDAIAGQCGYASDTTFRRIFKDATGLTLTAWQKANRP